MISGSGRTPMSLAPSCPTDRWPRAKEKPRDAEPNQTASREPGDPWPARDLAEHPADFGGDGHRDRKRHGDRDGAARRHGRDPQEPDAGAAGRPGPAGEEVRIGDGGEPADRLSGSDPRRVDGAENRP